jgi:hypothetical protein
MIFIFTMVAEIWIGKAERRRRGRGGRPHDALLLHPQDFLGLSSIISRLYSSMLLV